MATYKDSGVDISEAERAKKRIGELVRTTFKYRNVVGGFGQYSGMVEVGGKAIGIHTDGVGSKVLLAQKAGKYDTVGIDMVAMNVNDLICNALEPVALVDYIATEKLDVGVVEQLVKGICKGCEEANIALVGGETAILPEIIKGEPGKGFDLAGTVVGVADKDKINTGEKISEGDVLIGLESSGLHSNGYTLARKVLDTDDTKTLEEMLIPTRIYVRPVLEILRECEVHGLAHITGGAFTKLSRITKLGFEITLPPFKGIFKKLSASVDEKEMYKTFNCGVGFVIIAGKSEAKKIFRIAKTHGIGAFEIGKVTGTGKIIVNGVML